MKDLIKTYLENKMFFPVTTETLTIDEDILKLNKKINKKQYDEVINRLLKRIESFLQKQKIEL
jgi:hypothetical protein